MKNYFFLALISMLLFSINTIIQKKMSNIDSITLTLFTVGFAFVFILIIWLINFNNKILSLKSTILCGITGIIYSIAILLFIYSLRIGKIQIVVLLNGLSAGVTIILSFLILKESLNLYQIIGVCLGVIAIVFLNIK